MNRLAIIDATGHGESFGPGVPVAGLEAVVRAVRLAAVSEAEQCAVVASERYGGEINELLSREEFDAEVNVVSLSDTDAASELAGVVSSADEAFDAEQLADASSVMYLRSTTFGFRDIPGDLATYAEREPGVAWLELEEGDDGEAVGDFWAVDGSSWSNLVSVIVEEQPADIEGLATVLEEESALPVKFVTPPRSWQMRISTPEEAERAGDQIWEDCRKPTDGPVSRYLNRYVSMAVSRRLSRTDIRPNQVSVVALFVAMASAPIAVFGGYMGFLGATLVYKLNSIIDGIDGELSRGKYEYSDLGAWLDKFCDDCADLFWFVGCGIGAWRTGVSDPLGMGAEFWLWIIGIFLTGKALCSVSFYSIPFREGELVHPYRSLDWWFEDEEGDTRPGIGDRIAGFFKVLTGNDVFVGISLVFAIVGILPWFLILMGVGQVFVGLGRTYQIQQQWGSRREETAAAAGGE